MSIQASHPHHTGRKGLPGGSAPKVANNLVRACETQMEAQRGKVREIVAKHPNPLRRTK